jgi:hypothetical protein
MYVPLTHLERWIPLAFGVLYVALGTYALVTPADKKEVSQPQNQTVQQQPTQQSQSVQKQSAPATPTKP